MTVPGNAGWQRGLAVARHTQAGWFDRLGQSLEVLGGFRRATGTFRTLYERDRGNVVRRADRVEAGTALAAALVRADAPMNTPRGVVSTSPPSAVPS